MSPRAGALLAVLFWGVSFVATKRVVAEISPGTLLATRAALGLGVLFAMLRARRETLVPPRETWGSLFLMGFVGIAVHGGAETCLRAADVFATRSGLSPITEAVRGSRRTLAAIRRGVVISLTYNLLGVGLAALGMLSPLLAAIMMPLSSISVVSLALRAKTFEREKT